MASLPHPVQYQGSKRNLASNILELLRDFFGIKLTNADLSRANWDDSTPVGQIITGAILGEGDLSGTDFSANDMRGCNFSGSQLVGCRFDRADLTQVCFRDADLRNTSFVGAKLMRADLSEANLNGADFTGAELTEAEMPLSDSEVIWDEGIAVKEWVIRTIQYYRKINFFEQYNDLSDEQLANILKRLCRRNECFGCGSFTTGNDYEVIQFDRQRTLRAIPLDILYGDDPGEYNFEYAVQTLEKWEDISYGAFQPKNILDVGEYMVGLTIDGKKYQINPWEDPFELAPQLNPLIAYTGYQFEVWHLDSALVFALTVDDKYRLESERGLSFHQW